VTLALKKG